MELLKLGLLSYGKDRLWVFENKVLRKV